MSSESDIFNGERVAYVQRYKDGWKLEFQGRVAYFQQCNDCWKLDFQELDKIQFHKVEEIIISTTEGLTTNVDCRTADPGRQLMDANQSSLGFVEPKSKASTDVGSHSQVTVDERETKPDTAEVELLTPEENGQPTNQIVMKAYACLVCQKSFTNSHQLEDHARSRSHIRKSSICTKSVFGKNKVSLQRRNHASGKSHVCHQSFLQSDQLKSHVRSHEKKSNLRAKPFSIENEGIDAASDSKSPEPLVVTPHECLSFSQSSHLKNHVKPHEKKSNVTCYVCQKSCVHAQHLQTHLRKHAGERPYTCSFCLRSFTQSCNLKVHERLHTGDKPYQCVVCRETFSQLGSLQRHEKIHIGRRAFQCSVCEGTFSQLRSLNIHFRTHTREKSEAFKCY